VRIDSSLNHPAIGLIEMINHAQALPGLRRNIGQSLIAQRVDVIIRANKTVYSP
jgi:hypothetical protein